MLTAAMVSALWCKLWAMRASGRRRASEADGCSEGLSATWSACVQSIGPGVRPMLAAALVPASMVVDFERGVRGKRWCCDGPCWAIGGGGGIGRFACAASDRDGKASAARVVALQRWRRRRGVFECARAQSIGPGGCANTRGSVGLSSNGGGWWWLQARRARATTTRAVECGDDDGRGLAGGVDGDDERRRRDGGGAMASTATASGGDATAAIRRRRNGGGDRRRAMRWYEWRDGGG